MINERREAESGLKTRSLTLAALFAALMIAGAYISLPTPVVPITFQPFFSVLAGAVLGPRLGSMAMGAYIAIGLAGVPVFAGFTGGIGKVLTPTFGFIIGFLAAAALAGAITERADAGFGRVAAASAAGIAAIYAIGAPYMYIVFTLVSGRDVTLAATAAAMLPFFLKDLVLSLAASGIALRIIPLSKRLAKQ